MWWRIWFIVIGLIGFTYKIVVFNILSPIILKLWGIQLLPLTDVSLLIDLISLAGLNIYEGLDMNKVKKGMGFKKASENIQEKQGVSKEVADKELAASTRKASAKAKKANPNLKKVKGK